MFPAAEHHQALKGFRIQRRLGSGGAGDVYLALSKAGRPVAIKVLSDAKVRDDAVAQELAREASLCVRLSHPAIVQVRALIEEEGFAAIVFDYVEGIALARLIRLCSSRGVRLPDNAAWHIVERVASGLAYAHMQTDEARAPAPIVHRDVSPSNVLIAWTGDVKLADFGIAKMLGVSPATQYGLVKGTLGCMAPEQARGERVDERADVYAAGLLAWRLATGRNPYAAYEKDEIELLRAMRNPRIKPLSALRPDLPEAVTHAVERALAPQAEARDVTAEQLAAACRASLDMEEGGAELCDLLGRFRGALEKKRARAEGPSSSSSPSSSSFDSISSTSGSHKLATARYDDVAQDDELDEDIAFDRPTLQVQALPGDAAAWEGRATPDALSLPRAVPSESWLAAAPASPSSIPADAPRRAGHGPKLGLETPTVAMPLPSRAPKITLPEEDDLTTPEDRHASLPEPDDDKTTPQEAKRSSRANGARKSPTPPEPLSSGAPLAFAAAGSSPVVPDVPSDPQGGRASVPSAPDSTTAFRREVGRSPRRPMWVVVVAISMVAMFVLLWCASTRP